MAALTPCSRGLLRHSLIEVCRLIADGDASVEVCHPGANEEQLLLTHAATGTSVAVSLPDTEPFGSAAVLDTYKDPAISIGVERADLVSALSRVDAINSASSDVDDPRVILEQIGSELSIEFSRGSSQINDTIAAEVVEHNPKASDMDSRFALQPRFLQDAIKATDGDKVRFERFLSSRPDSEMGVRITDPDAAAEHVDLVMPIQLPPRVASTAE